jgi:Tfp pilus assembly protein PilO
MDKLKQWLLFTALGVVAVVAASWFLLISPKHQDASATRDEVAAQRTTNQALTVELEVLQAKAAELPQKRAALEQVTAKIPTGPDLPTLVRALTAAAASSGVQLISVTPGAPAAPTAQAPVPPPAPAAAAGAAATPAPPVPVAVPPAADAAGALAAIPLGIEVAGSFFDVEHFVGQLEELPRAVRVTGLTVAPGTSAAMQGKALSRTSGPTVKASVTGSVYMATGAAAAAAPVPTIPAPTS